MHRRTPSSPVRRWLRRVHDKTPRSLAHTVPVVHEESPEVRRRRRRVVAGTSLAGAAALGVGLSTPPGSRRFYVATLAAAGVYATGGLASGPLHLGWIQLRDRSLRRPVLTPVATGAAAFGGFWVAAQVARRIPPLAGAVASVLQFADEGEDRLVLTTTLANAVAEEIFFRGAVYAALEERSPILGSTAVYVASTLATRNPALVLAAVPMGTLWALQRRSSKGLLASALTHVTWSALMLRHLPPVFRDVPPAGRTAAALGPRPAVA